MATSKATLKNRIAFQMSNQPNLSQELFDDIIDNCWNNVTNSASTFTADDATPSVSGYTVWTTANVNATTITMLDGGFAGQMVTIIIGDAVTTIDFSGTHLYGNVGVDWTPSAHDHMVCSFDGTDWYCNVSDNTAAA